jgi:hypothetical protein
MELLTTSPKFMTMPYDVSLADVRISLFPRLTWHIEPICAWPAVLRVAPRCVQWFVGTSTAAVMNFYVNGVLQV